MVEAEQIEQWFQKWFHNHSGISDNTHVYNRLREAVEDLKNTATAAMAAKEEEE